MANRGPVTFKPSWPVPVGAHEGCVALSTNLLILAAHFDQVAETERSDAEAAFKGAAASVRKLVVATLDECGLEDLLGVSAGLKECSARNGLAVELPPVVLRRLAGLLDEFNQNQKGE